MEQHQSEESAMTPQEAPTESQPIQAEEPKFRVGDLAIFRFSNDDVIELRCGVIRGKGEQDGTLSVAWEQKVFNVPLMALVSTAEPMGLRGNLDKSALVEQVESTLLVLRKVDTVARSARTDDVGFGFSVEGHRLDVGPELARATSLALATQAKLDFINAALKLLNSL